MANAIYPKYKTALGTGAANVSLNVDDATNGVFALLIDTADEAYNAADEFYSDLTGAGIVGEVRITGNTFGSVSQGTLDGANVTFSAVSGDSVEAIIIYRKNAGANTTWRLVAFIDTGQTGLPVTPNGGDITITWDAAGIFTL